MLGTIGFALLLAMPLVAAETNSVATGTDSVSTNTNTDAVANGILQLQAQLHDAQMQIEQSRRQAAEEAQSNAATMSARMDQLEQTIAAQRTADAEVVRRTQQLTFYVVGTVGIAALAVLLLMGYFQWRAFAQLTEITSRQTAALSAVNGVHQLAAPGRATVEVSNARLLDIVGQLEKKILELEKGGRLLAEPPARSSDPLEEGQRFLDANEPQIALECFEKILSRQPQNPEALAKKAAALEKLGRDEEALSLYDRAIAADGGLVIAYLHKGGLLNKLARYDEALKCYERALLVQEKKT